MISSPLNLNMSYRLKNRKPISHRLKNKEQEPSPKQNLQDFIEVYNIKRQYKMPPIPTQISSVIELCVKRKSKKSDQ